MAKVQRRRLLFRHRFVDELPSARRHGIQIRRRILRATATKFRNTHVIDEDDVDVRFVGRVEETAERAKERVEGGETRGGMG